MANFGLTHQARTFTYPTVTGCNFRSKPKTPRVKRSSSTVENPEDEQRRHMSQPVPNQLTNVERKDKAKKTRKSRRSTQGVTIDTVNEAKKLFDELEEKRKLENKKKMENENATENNEKNNRKF